MENVMKFMKDLLEMIEREKIEHEHCHDEYYVDVEDITEFIEEWKEKKIKREHMIEL